MLRSSAFTAFFTALIFLSITAGLVGCSNGNNTVTPSDPSLASTSPSPAPAGDGVSLGNFQFVFDTDGSVRVEEAAPVRGAEINVTKFASVVIENFFFDEPSRNWYITATIKNISSFTGHDVLAVFHTLGSKFVTNQDGYIWAMPPIFPDPTRCAFIAYGKEQPARVYPPMFMDTRTIVIHQPDGVPKLAPIGFWIEAWGLNRKFPGCEDLKVDLVDNSNYPPEYQLTGNVWDHQSPSANLQVWADCTSFNGQNHIDMFDDGQHGDGAAADDIFGTMFSGDPEDGEYTITVYSMDPQGNIGENDVTFNHGTEAPCDLPFEHYPFQTIAKGESSGIQELTEMVINDTETWNQVWANHTSNIQPAPPAPPIDFTQNTLIGVWLGPRPSNNHMVTITDVYLDPCENLVTCLYDYSPNEGCGPEDIMTYPFHIVILPKFEYPVYFVGNQVGCPPPPPECVESIEFTDVIHGVNSGIHNPYESVIKFQDAYFDLWHNHVSNMYPAPPPPGIDWENKMLVAVGLGDRPTSGFECNITKVCHLSDNTIGVFYTEKIPGPECPVFDVITQPHHWVIIPRSDATVNFIKNTEVYDCGNEDCQNPLIFYPIAEGDHSGHPAGEFVFMNQESFNGFWQVHQPDTTPPTINFEEQMVFAMLIGQKPSTGYFVQTNEVCLNTDPETGLQQIDVKYTEHQPGENCQVLWVLTQPWQIVVAPRHEVPVYFHKSVVVDDCPPQECVDINWQPLEDGLMSCDEPGEYGLFGYGDWFHNHWWDVHCWGPDETGYMPAIPPAQNGYTWIPFTVTLESKPSTGYYMQVDDVCIKGCDVFVTYTEYQPGENCNVSWIVTKPWNFWIAEIPTECTEGENLVWHFEKNVSVYDCNPPCEPAPFYTLDQQNGIFSCQEAGEYGWQSNDGYQTFWNNTHCEMPPVPPLPTDPEPVNGGIIYHFGIQLDQRPTTGYYLSIDSVCVDGCDVYIDYTENIPGEGCEVYQMVTKPYIVAAAELPAVYCAWTWHFTRHENVYDCTNPCFYFLPVASGTFSGEKEAGGFLIQNEEQWNDYWTTYHPDEPSFPIDFANGWAAYAVHLGARPTTGYSLDVYEICPAENPFGAAVRWLEHIPGETCVTEDLVNTPWTIVTFQLVDMPYYDEGTSEVYQCK